MEKAKQERKPALENFNKGGIQSSCHYEKDQFVSQDHIKQIIHLLENGAIVEIKKEGLYKNKTSFFDIRVYYSHPNIDKGNPKF